ncbi:MAG: YggS family pyridoxal phosphate-dependent enzyme [Candidatus Diapherotrites archaeon]|nr:YggS family pyridoxal phosphate-dependent enzyme [Candidatus Diapherotrites archaeon]
MIAQNLKQVSARMHTAAIKSGRNPESVQLLPITKERALHEIKELVSLGFHTFGESKIQELERKVPLLSHLKWHFVGHLQTNKAKHAVSLCETIHSVDSLKLAQALQKHAHEMNRYPKIFLEINVSGEKSKYGFTPAELEAALPEIKAMPNLQLQGLMTMAPLTAPEKTRPTFKGLKQLAKKTGLKELSMGMSNDFEVAIEEGATIVRIGTALFEKGKK